MWFSRPRNRYLRTFVLGMLAMAVLVWSAIDQFGIPLHVMTELFITSAIIVFATIGCAALAAGCWLGLRRLWRRRREDR